MEERVVPFVYGGYVSPIDRAQMEIVMKFFQTMEKAVKLGSEKLGLVHSKIVDNKFYLKITDDGYYLIDPDPETPTVIRTNKNLKKIQGNFGILESQIIEITARLEKKINEAGSSQVSS